MYVIFYCTINYCLIVNVLAKVNNVITIVFKKYLYNVLADIVDIALYCCKDYLALRNAFSPVDRM